MNFPHCCNLFLSQAVHYKNTCFPKFLSLYPLLNMPLFESQMPVNFLLYKPVSLCIIHGFPFFEHNLLLHFLLVSSLHLNIVFQWSDFLLYLHLQADVLSNDSDYIHIPDCCWQYHHTFFDSIQMVLCFLYAVLIPLPAYDLLKYLQKLFLLVRMNPAYWM